MAYEQSDTPDDEVELVDEEVPAIEERLTALRSNRSSAGGYSPQARQRIEYLQELRRLRAQIGDDGIETF